jgi:hypothetical protein
LAQVGHQCGRSDHSHLSGQGGEDGVATFDQVAIGGISLLASSVNTATS